MTALFPRLGFSVMDQRRSGARILSKSGPEIGAFGAASLAQVNRSSISDTRASRALPVARRRGWMGRYREGSCKSGELRLARLRGSR